MDALRRTILINTSFATGGMLWKSKAITWLMIISIVLLFIGCGQTPEETDQWKTIEIGDYLFDFPPDFKLAEDNDNDSRIGKIQGDSIWFDFNFGFYPKDFELTTEEYLEKGIWKDLASFRFSKIDSKPKTAEQIIAYGDPIELPEIEVLSIRPATEADSSIGKGCDYIALCKHDTVEFNYPVYIPAGIKQLNFKIDTVDGQHRRIVYSKDPQKGATGIYITDTRVSGVVPTLSMITNNLTQQQQETALKIFETGRHKIQIK